MCYANLLFGLLTFHFTSNRPTKWLMTSLHEQYRLFSLAYSACGWPSFIGIRFQRSICKIKVKKLRCKLQRRQQRSSAAQKINRFIWLAQLILTFPVLEKKIGIVGSRYQQSLYSICFYCRVATCSRYVQQLVRLFSDKLGAKPFFYTRKGRYPRMEFRFEAFIQVLSTDPAWMSMNRH